MEDTSRAKILVVDDVKSNLVTMRGMLQALHYIPYMAQNANAAIRILEKQLPDLMLLDISMPDMDGFELCEMLKENPRTRNIPVIFISAVEDQADKERGFELGAVDFIQKPFDLAEVAIRIKLQLRFASIQGELESSNRRLNLVTRQLSQKLWKEQQNLIFAMARLVEGRDEGTVNHIDNLSYNSWILAQALQLTEDFEEVIGENFVQTIKTAVALHDIGKLSVSDLILLKKATLTEGERQIMQIHTTEGKRILTDISKKIDKNEFMEMAIEIAYSHHEHWDGSGYPQGLKGDQIPLAAQILGIVDVFDALVNTRVYNKEVCSREEAMETIHAAAGTQFDSRIVAVMERIQRHLKV
jgi:putative two-component system response regulator